tara:strand:+ start:2536 stop:2862 length:327 start_codon:yes stop_codon:yes gene_type:complete
MSSGEEGAAIIAAVDEAIERLDHEQPAPIKPKHRRVHIKPDVIISKRMEKPPIRSGTNRYRNMVIVMQCHTVGEALKRLKALEKSPGGSTDIKLAEKAGAIALLHPSD